MTAELAAYHVRAAEAAVMRGDALELLHGVKKLEVFLLMLMITASSASPPCAVEASSSRLS
jgi:hypothetical protein